MSVERSNRRYGAAQMRRIARGLLEASTLCAISTVSSRGRPHVHTAYFAWDADLRLVWLSDPGARHSRNLHAAAAAAVAVYDSTQRWGHPDRGIQLFGDATEAVGRLGDEAERVYAARFPGFRPEELAGLRLYVFRPHRIKLFDEPALGSGVFVTARVRARGRLTWDRTQIYR